jgi:thioredoxin reductase (NADPH)
LVVTNGLASWNGLLPPETSLPGVFAVGNVRYGSIMRVASAVSEGATAIQIAGQYLDEAPVLSL